MTLQTKSDSVAVEILSYPWVRDLDQKLDQSNSVLDPSACWALWLPNKMLIHPTGDFNDFFFIKKNTTQQNVWLSSAFRNDSSYSTKEYDLIITAMNKCSQCARYQLVILSCAVQKAAVVLLDEEQSKAEGRGEMSETELLIMDQFTVLVRDLYAFYPLLIRFVDYNRYTVLHVLFCFVLFSQTTDISFRTVKFTSVQFRAQRDDNSPTAFLH